MNALVTQRPPISILPALLAALWLIDTAATICFVMEHGSAIEANPVMRAVIDSVGIAGFAIIKATVLMLWVCIQHRTKAWVHVVLIAIMAPVALLAAVVAWGST